MKLLTATTETQGRHPDDFAWCTPGELVTPAGSFLWEISPDGGCNCGCRRSFAGLSSHKATTTAIVADLNEFSFEDLVTVVRGYRDSAGWAESGLDPDEDARHEALIITEIAAAFEAGDVLRVHEGEVNLCGSACGAANRTAR